MPRLTRAYLAQAVAESKWEAFERGKQKGIADQIEKQSNDFHSAKLEQMRAAVKLMEEVGRMTSRIGYMIGKINGDNNR